MKKCPNLLKDDKCTIKKNDTRFPEDETYCLRYCNNPNYQEWASCSWIKLNKDK